MQVRPPLSPKFIRLLQLTVTLLAVLYMLLIGGTFDATVRFRVQLLNFIAASALALLWLIVRFRTQKGWRASGLELPLLLFAGTQWLALLTSAQPRLGLEWAAGLVAWGAAFCIFYDLLASGWPREYVTNALLIVGAIMAGDGIWAALGWYANWARLGQWPPETFRFDGLLGHANLTAGVLNLLLPLVIVAAAASRPWRRLALIVLAAAMLITEFFTSSRAGWLACGLCLAALGFLLVYRRGGLGWLYDALASWSSQHRWLSVTSLVGLIVSALGVAWLLAKQAQHITHGSLIDSRLFFWTVAWDLFRRQPLTGSGPDLYPWFYSRYSSIPPDFFAPHAHSLVFQILSGSGLLGLAGLTVVALGAAWLLWQGWVAAGLPVESAALIAGLMSVAVHNLFDYLFGTPILLFLVLVVAALALAPLPGSKLRPIRPLLWLAAALLVPIGVFAFTLGASYWNDIGLADAAQDQWPAAAAALEQAGRIDPGMALYLEEAAYAETRAGQTSAATFLWQQAMRSDPYWAVLPASIGAVKQDASVAAAARSLAPGSYLFALNAGAIAEAQGNTDLEREAYTTALNQNPAVADALYWQQSPERTNIRDLWRSNEAPDNSALTAGWAAVRNNTPGQAIPFFQAAHAANPASLLPYEGLSRAYLELHDFEAARRAINAGLALPVTKLEETLGLHLIAGDLDDARGDRAGAVAEYSLVFSAVSDFNIDGPGSFGDTGREWQVFHREALPAELIPQLPRAEITAEMDQRFAKLAQWYADEGQPSVACWIVERVHQEAPKSVSGSTWPCPYKLVGTPQP